MKTLLHTLADGEYHSGEELGRLLGISRTAIWKQMQKDRGSWVGRLSRKKAVVTELSAVLIYW